MADGGYPAEVNRIIISHCTTGEAGGGCHNSIGAENAAGLRLDTWDQMFFGNNHGAVVVPYDTANSALLHYINIDSTLGSIALPTMPLHEAPLSKAEYLTIKNWIAQGAPDKAGNIPFADNAATRQKIYITNQAGDYVSVIDAARQVIMRNIKVGIKTETEAPHCIRVSKDGEYAYVTFLNGSYIQKIDTRTDQVIGQADLNATSAQWNILAVSDDGSRLVVSDLTRGWLRILNANTMKVITTVGNDALPTTPFKTPHGIALTPDFDTIYMTAQQGNTVFKFAPDLSFIKYVSIDGNPSNYLAGTRDPHEILLSPDGSRYFLSCEASHELRVMDARADTLIKAIPVPTKPQELALSRTKPYLFVTCMESATSVAGAKGVVAVINYETLQLVKIINGPFWQPHGIAVDDQSKTFYVVSTNIGGPFNGHNHTGGSGKAGWYNVYDLNTLELSKDKQYETLSQPYSADSRMK